MKRRYVTNFIVLDTDGWADRTQPLSSNEGGWNSETGEVRIGPGLWDDLAPETGEAATAYQPGIAWNFDQDQSTPGLGAGQFRMNNSFAQAATKLYMHVTDDPGTDRTALLSLFTSGIFKAYRAGAPPLVYRVLTMTNDGVTPTFFTFDVQYISGARPTQGEVLYLDFQMDAPGVQVYTATLDQTGTNAPVAIGESNTTPFTPVYAHAGTGTFTLGLVGLPLDPAKVKVSLVNGNSSAPNMVGAAYIEDGETIEMTTYNAAGSASNGILIRATITVTVTP